MPAATNQQVIAGLYAGFFNRAPDLEGLQYWEDRASTGNPSTIFDEIAAGFASHSVFTSTYGNMNNNQFAQQIYQNVLGTAGDAEGIAYWTTFLDTHARSEMVSSFVHASLTVDLNSSAFDYLTTEQKTQAQSRQDLLTNKANVALQYVTTYGLQSNVQDSNNPENDPAYLRSIQVLSNVNATADSVTAAINELESSYVPFKFSAEWLVGKTLYNVYDDGNDGMYELDVITFGSNGTGNINGAYGSSPITYSVDANGIITMSDGGGQSYIKVIEDQSGALHVAYNETYQQTYSATVGEEYFFLNQNDADEYIGVNEAPDSIDITAEWLTGKTIYNIWDDGHDGIAEMATMTFYGNGIGYVVDTSNSGNFTYSVDANAVLTISSNVPGLVENGTSYIKAIQMDDAVNNAVRIEWTADYADALTYTAGEEYEYVALDSTAMSQLQALIASNASGGSSNNNGFYFTSEWLSGRTIYDITGAESGWNNTGDRHLINDITTMTFNANGTVYRANNLGGSAQENWSVDNNDTIIFTGGSEGTWYMRASGETIGTNAYVVYSTDMSYSAYSTNDYFTPEAIALDLATAQGLIGTVLPAENVFNSYF